MTQPYDKPIYGLVLWGGFKTTAPTGPLPWDENTPWWGDDQGKADG
jgi:hypothetical protein